MHLTSHILGWPLQGNPKQALGSSCQASRSLEGHGGVEVSSKLWLISTLSTSDRWRGICCQLQIGWAGPSGGDPQSVKCRILRASELGRPACSIAHKVGVFPSPKSALILFHIQVRGSLPNQCPKACNLASPLIEAT